MHRPHVVVGALSILMLSYAARDASAFQEATPPPPRVYEVGKDGVSSPKLIKEVKPKYTADAMRARIEGLVVLSGVVMPDGKVGTVAVTRSLDSRYGLDQEAVMALRQWRFAPGMKDGAAVAVLVEIEMAFTMGAKPRRTPAAASWAGVSQTDEYARYELLAPETASYKVTFEVSVTSAGARQYVDPIRPGSVASSVSVVDLMTGAPLAVEKTTSAIVTTLARPVPRDGHGRLRIEKTVKDAKSYSSAGGVVMFSEPLASRRGSLVLPAGFELISCNLPAQVLSETDGRVGIAFMNQAPGHAVLTVKARTGAASGPGAAPTPLTSKRSWEPPASQGSTERARLTERAHQDRDITYFLKDPSTNAFSLFHDYTESRSGIDKYINVVRSGSRVSDPSAYVLDTGEVLKQETLKGSAITDAKLDIGQAVMPETEAVVVRFPPITAGQSLRLRISETYTAPESYRLDGNDLVFERSFGRPRNSVVLPPGWYLTASSIPAVVSETADGRIRLDFMNGRPDSIDVFVKARRRPGS